MAAEQVKFDSKRCRDLSSQLNNAKNQLNSLFEGELDNAVKVARAAYESETAEEIFRSFNELKSQMPDFLQKISNCAIYLNDVVAPAYEEAERKAANKLQQNN